MMFQMQATEQKNQNRNNQVKSVVIIGGNMFKHLNGWDTSKKVHKSECKTYVKSFLGAKTPCRKDSVKPSLRSTPNHFLLHVGTNDLQSNFRSYCKRDRSPCNFIKE